MSGAPEASSPIRVILRLRPTSLANGFPSPAFSIRHGGGALTVASRPTASRNAAEAHTLDGVTVLPCSATQEDCYAAVARDLVEGAVIGGVSATILA